MNMIYAFKCNGCGALSADSKALQVSGDNHYCARTECAEKWKCAEELRASLDAAQQRAIKASAEKADRAVTGGAQ